MNIFNETILNTLRNFIPHETVLCDDRDPPWFNNKIKSLIHEKNITFKRLRSDRRNSCLRRQLNCLQDRLNDSIEASKQKYYCRMTNKLTNAEKSSKAYWSILKSFLNNKKIPLIPPLFYENCFITNFKEKIELSTLSLLTNALLWVTLVSYHPILRSITTIDYLQLLFRRMILVKLFKI